MCVGAIAGSCNLFWSILKEFFPHSHHNPHLELANGVVCETGDHVGSWDGEAVHYSNNDNMKVRWCRDESTNPGMIDAYETILRARIGGQTNQSREPRDVPWVVTSWRRSLQGSILWSSVRSLDHFTLRAPWSARRRIYWLLTPSKALSRACSAHAKHMALVKSPMWRW